ncbi:MAG TPA: FadR/GntR family transcriptional regulator [Devosiaceae bacterium]|jgi:GntR family transcriptional repressor for pyruvate dehydrogenase complex
MEPVKGSSRRAPFAEQVYSQLRRLIERGEFPRNARLPPEEELGQRFGVSRPIIRQALGRLVDEGVVETRKGSGTIVRVGPTALQSRFPTLDSVADVQQFYEFRIDVESRTVAMAAQRYNLAQLAEMEEALLGSERAIEAGNLRVAADLNFSFHRAIAKASGNRFHETAIELLPNVIGHVGDEFRIGTSDEEAERARVIVAEHHAILDAIRQRDALSASRLMIEHITSAQNYLYANISVRLRSADESVTRT